MHERLGVFSRRLLLAERKLRAALYDAFILLRHRVAVRFHLTHDLLPNAFQLFQLLKLLTGYDEDPVSVRARLHVDGVMLVAENLVFQAS